MSKRTVYELDLMLFGEGGGAGAGAGAAAGDGAAGDGAGAGQMGPVETGKRGKANPLASVAYGIQDEETAPAKETDTTVTTDDAAKRQAEFDSFIRANKDLYDARVKQTVDRRFKGQQAMEAELTEARAMMDVLKRKYGGQTAKELREAVEADSTYWEAEAEKRGLTIEQTKHVVALEESNAQFLAAEKQREHQAGVQQAAARWMQQAEALAQKYPGFDLDAELESEETGERFANLLRAGIDVENAYKLIHMDELMSGAIGYAVQTTQKKTMDSIRARGMRPRENGGGGHAAATVVRKDPAQWTKADREEVSRRVLRGETIRL